MDLTPMETSLCFLPFSLLENGCCFNPYLATMFLSWLLSNDILIKSLVRYLL